MTLRDGTTSMPPERRGFFDVRVPMFRPLWRRIAATAVTAGWAALELTAGNPGFALLFAAAAAVLFYQFFLDWRPPEG
ncbi:hypothetical protein E2L08_14670 [Palleronia sediminis]|uniref:DUF3329 domain-containing protein n=1 Tax=Palleronia sediminis TaxID=2547833 RepID=A0A4R6A0Q3_9RHOB|nr:hypothetical protein [Palleronia sediminis]TDL75957.1 hypothetical protein E2L08_14670 [Palleronia sediminis]